MIAVKICLIPLNVDPQPILPIAAVWGARTMLSSKPCNASGTVKLVQLVLGKYPKINRSLSTGTELELQIFEAVNVPLAMQNQILDYVAQHVFIFIILGMVRSTQC